MKLKGPKLNRDWIGLRVELRRAVGNAYGELPAGTKGVINYQPEYTVTFETLPLDVNDDAKVEPHAGNLQVNCADKKFVLENYNYPKKASFTWSPDKCGDVSLTIFFPDITLQRTYKGVCFRKHGRI